jgi:hypothetical protein
MKIPSEALILGAISVAALLVLALLTNEYFANPTVASQKKAVMNAHANLPMVAPDQVAAAKQGLKNIIQNRPDLVAALQQVLSDPEIRPTVQMVLNGSPPAPPIMMGPAPAPSYMMGPAPAPVPSYMMGPALSSSPSYMMAPEPTVMMAPTPSIMMAPAATQGPTGACVNCGQDTCEDSFIGTSLGSSPGPF